MESINFINFCRCFKVLIFLSLPSISFAGDNIERTLDLTNHWVGYVSLGLFFTAYVLVILEEFTHFSKSIAVIFVAGVIWAMIAWIYTSHNLVHNAEMMLRHNLLEYAELFLFLLVAMTYIEAMKEHRVFDALRSWLVNKGFTLRKLFWMTGFLAFFLSPIADNLTTALIMGAVVMAVGGNNMNFISIAFVNIVVAANAGGAFSPFGDITTLMVWQTGIVKFSDFFSLFIPSLINFVVPAAIMHFFIKKKLVDTVEKDGVVIKKGGKRIIVLFAATIVTAVSFHSFLNLPPAMGMITGLSYLMIAAFFVNKQKHDEFDVFKTIARAEWDTLLFFLGVILSVGGLSLIGYLAFASELMYGSLGSTNANILVGALSAVIDNIPMMFAILEMNPAMNLSQWLLVTLTVGVGGSLLSVGSAAGVALMGQSKGIYTFMSHLKWMPVIALGYAASILVHLWINQSLLDASIK